MKIGIMQPYLFPYLGYFDLIHYTDRWIFFDTGQYIRHGWVNRNRILHPTSGWQYIVAPLQKHARDTPITDIRVQEGTAWKDRIIGQLQHYKNQAPFFHETLALVQEMLAISDLSLARLCGHSVVQVCRHLGLPLQVEYFSEMNLEMEPVNDAGEWALHIAKALGCSTYVNPVGGRDIFDPDKFRASGIDLVLRPFTHMRYDCRRYGFEEGLSVIDVLMWNPATEVKAFLDDRLHVHDRLELDRH